MNTLAIQSPNYDQQFTFSLEHWLRSDRHHIDITMIHWILKKDSKLIYCK